MSEVRDVPASFFSPRWDWMWVIQWTILFACNLIAPFILGLMATEIGGRYGMIAGILVLWGMGLPICYLSKDMRRSVLIGGTILACIQFVPVGHALIGSLTIQSWRKTTGLGLDTADFASEISGFGITVLTGQFLLALSAGGIHFVRVLNRIPLQRCKGIDSKSPS